ncbi:g11637 [Coccomyxa elongata]
MRHLSRCQALQTAPQSADETTLEQEEVMIRRRAPDGVPQQPCGAMTFKIPQTDENKPRNILEEIVWWKAQELVRMKEKQPLTRLSMLIKSAPPSRDFIGALREAKERIGKPGLIAEVKKASPSRGVIQPDFDPVKIAKAYEAGGAACLSVLTDAKYFQGSFEYLAQIRAAGVATPLLCKEFIVEAYQLFKARASGADAVLLIAAVLPNADLAYLIKAANKCGLQVLVEVHTVAELERVLKLDMESSQVMLGINNRDLQTFKVDIENNRRIMESSAGQQVKERGFLMAGESGIFTPEHVAFVQSTGCGAILVGESLVKEGDPEAAVKRLLSLA